MSAGGGGRGRIRYLPVSIGLGLFVGDVAALALADDLTLGRAAVSAVVAVLAWAAARWVVARRTGGG